MPELRCSSCDAVIDGRIVKCLECEHFTLCRRCDESDVHDHHVMVRAERQRFFNFVSIVQTSANTISVNDLSLKMQHQQQ